MSHSLVNMWSTPKLDHVTYLDQCFNELVQECRHAAPGARLTYTIRNRLEKLTLGQRKEIVSRLSDGCSPLFIASKRGNVEIVEYLIEQCGADVEQKGVFEVSDDRSVHTVTPLWSASVAGKLDVVKCLVKHGANVNSISDTGSTPVRSACFMTHLEIVKFLVKNGADILKPNHNGGTCLINSVQSVPLCQLLLENGADVNAQDIQLKTALHYAIQEHRYETTKLLIEFGANPLIKNRYGDDALQTACLKGAVQIFEYLTTFLQFPLRRIAESYELLGSTFLDEHFDLRLTISYWVKALKLRKEHNLSKSILLKWTNVFAGMHEFQSMDELCSIMNDLDAMRMQSLLISERILGSMHKEMIYRLMYRGAAYADGLQYQRCIDLWKYAFELRIKKDSLLHNEAAFTAHALVRLFMDLNDRITSGHVQEQFKYEDIHQIIRMIVSQFKTCQELLKIRPLYKKHSENFDKILKILSYLIYLINSISKTDRLKLKTLELVKRIRAITPRNSTGDTLLHLVVSKSNTMKSSMTGAEDTCSSVFPDYSVCHLLVQAGFYVDATNACLETPLHVVSSYHNFDASIVQLLLENGSHIDQKDLTGNQPCKRLASINDYPFYPMRHLTLKCLASSKIKSFHIPYAGQVPPLLEKFINLH